METKVLTAHVPLSLSRKIDELAARLERSRGWIVKQALSAWIEGERLVRRVLVGNYEMRYEIQPSGMFILRVWHARENR